MDFRRLKVITMVFSRLRNIVYLLRRGEFKSAYSYLWSSIFTRDSGIALLDPLWRKFPALAPYPEAIEIEPTTRCHLRCSICEHTYWHEKPRDMSLDEFRRIVEQFPRLKWIGITGIGDQFLNRDFMRMLEYLKSKGVYIEFFNTFDLIDEKTADRLIALRVDKIWLSCDAATAETYEKVQTGARFDNVMKNARYFIEAKKRRKALIPELWFHYIVNKHNVAEMPQYVDMAASLMKGAPNAATVIFFTGMMEFPEVMSFKQWEIPADIRNAVYEKIRRHGFYLIWNENIERSQQARQCTKWTEPFILVTGHIQPCCVLNEANDRDFQKEAAFMNLLEGDFREYWKSKEFKGFLRTLHSNNFPRVCKNCKVYSRCSPSPDPSHQGRGSSGIM